MKRIIFIILSFTLLFANTKEVLAISAESAILMLSDTHEVIYEKNADERMPMASTTKIMTAILALEKCNPGAVVTVSQNASGQEGSSIYIEAGDKIKMEDLLYGLMLNSGNDAAVAIAEYCSGNVESFASEMTGMAKRIGALNTSFKNPNGLDQEGHYTTAYDLALITAYAMQNEDFRRIVACREKSAAVNENDILYFRNHNKLLKLYSGAIGVKTGYTKKSGRCLVSAAEKDGVKLIAVTLNAPDDWNDHIKMMDLGFSASENAVLFHSGEPFKVVCTEERQELGCVLGEEIYVNVFKGNPPESELVLHLPKRLLAPIYSGEKIGEGEVMVNGRLYKRVDILADRDVLKSTPERAVEGAVLRVIKKFFFLG